MQLTRLLRLSPVLLAVGLVATLPSSASAAASAATGDTTFSKAAAPFTFRYPSAFRVAPYHGGSSLNKPRYEVALGLGTHDYLLVQAYTLKITVKRDGSARDATGKALPTSRVDAIVDATIGQLANRAGFTSQKPVSTGRLGALRARVYRVSKPDRSLSSVLIVALSGKTEYYLACQSTPKGASTVSAACARVTATFAKR